MKSQIDLLIERIRKTGNPTCVGLDTRVEYLPKAYLDSVCPDGVDSMEKAARAILQYNIDLLDAVADLIPSVKVQVAYYEMYGLEGMKAFYQTVKEAKARDLTVIVDVKRNDIGATAEAYSAAYLGETSLPKGAARACKSDFATVNPYLGEDGIKPFLKDIAAHGTGIFALVKTSNPSSGQLQDLMIGEKTVYQVVGDLVSEWGKDSIGEYGYSAVGAVVGATYPEQGTELRKRLPHTFFLVPGYGAQGAKGEDLKGCFDEKGEGAVVNASRSILCAWKKHPEMDFKQAARAEVIAMRDDIASALGKN